MGRAGSVAKLLSVALLVGLGPPAGPGGGLG